MPDDEVVSIEEWRGTVDPEYQDAVKDFKTPADVSKGYANLLQSQGTMIKPLAEDASEEDTQKFYQRFAPEKYSWQPPEGSDETFVKEISTTAKELGVADHQFAKLASKYTEFQKKAVEAHEAETKRKVDSYWEKYKTEWGPDKTKENITIAQRTFETFAPQELKDMMTIEQVKDDPILVAMYSEIGRKTLDDSLIKGNPPEHKDTPKSRYGKQFQDQYGNKK